MFALTSNAVNAPVVTPMFPTPAQGSTTITYLEDFRCSEPTTQATVGSMIYAFAHVAANGPDDALRANCRSMFMGDSYTPILALMDLPIANPITDLCRINQAIILNNPNAPAWIVNLVSASKKKPLSASNVEGFFAMLGHTGTKGAIVARFVNLSAQYFPDSIGDDAFRATLADGIWTTYRNTRVSTGVILRNLLPDFRALRITVTGDANEAAINACANAPWDTNLSLAIPDKIKAYGSIFLEAAGIPIDNWHQGNKAVSNLPASRVRGAKAIFKKYLEVKNTVTGVDAMTNVAAFTASDSVRSFFL